MLEIIMCIAIFVGIPIAFIYNELLSYKPSTGKTFAKIILFAPLHLPFITVFLTFVLDKIFMIENIKKDSVLGILICVHFVALIIGPIPLLMHSNDNTSIFTRIFSAMLYWLAISIYSFISGLFTYALVAVILQP